MRIPNSPAAVNRFFWANIVSLRDWEDVCFHGGKVRRPADEGAAYSSRKEGAVGNSMFERNNHLLAMSCLLTLSANGQTLRHDTITDRTHQLQEVTVTETRKQHQVTSTAPLHILDREEMLTLGVTDVADALHRLPGVTLRDYGGAGGMKTDRKSVV